MSALDQVRQPSLVRTLTIRLVTAALALLALQASIIAIRDYLNETDFHDNYVRGEAQRLATLVHAKGPGLAGQLPPQYSGDNAAAYAFRIVDSKGRVLASHNVERIAQLSPWPGGTSTTQNFWAQQLAEHERMHVAGGLHVRRGDRSLWVELATFGDPDGTYMRHIAHDIFDGFLVPLVPLLLLTIAVATFSVRSSLRPLVRAADRADEISILERGERLDVTRLPAEAYHFASATNRLLDRVTDLVATQRLFIARASHELRTPLSIMMLELDKLPEADARRLENDLRAMSHIVDQLLALSRMEAIEKPTMVPVDLCEIVREIVERMTGLAEQAGHSIVLDCRGPEPIEADETALREAVRNLVDNAIKHTPAGTAIRVEVTQAASIVVDDDGPGLGTLKAEELQMPFRKGSAASDGAGLGLAIARQAAELNGGRLEISRSPSGGARFAIHLPPNR
jgi:signal transduction histidine kinase